MNIDRIQIIGRGNVASHLAKALSPHVKAEIVNPHTLEGLNQDTPLTIISVTDDAIQEAAHRISGKSGIVCHTSGSKPMQLLEGTAEHIGVFYPMQTFSKNVALDYSEIPFFIEGDCPETAGTLKSVASLISGNVRECTSQSRRLLHIAAVFCCNFPNHLYAIASEILKDEEMDLSVMLPLIKESAGKIINGNEPSKVQTGPAARNDRRTIAGHMEYLQEHHPDYADLYARLSESIIHRSK